MKVVLLLHFYQDNEFLGQTLMSVQVENWDQLSDLVNDVYPAGKILTSPKTKTSPRFSPPKLKKGYGPGTSIRVIQIIPQG